MPDEMSHQDVKETIRLAAKDDSLANLRTELAQFTAKTFSDAGQEMFLIGHFLGTDHTSSVSPFGHRSDETVAVSMLLRMATQLVSGSAELLIDGRPYAGAALVRQIVEIEYLAWAMATRDGDGERWLRSNHRQRESFFSPAKLRKAAQGTFRGKDYSYHCELGGHPTPHVSLHLDSNPALPQLLLSDMLGHAGRIWDHLAHWGRDSTNGGPILNRHQQMLKRFSEWKSLDPLAELPPPP